MTRRYLPKAGTLLAILLTLGVAGVSADPPRRDEYQRRDGAKPRIERNYQLDRRYHHNRYYPPRGLTVETLPRAPVVIPHLGTNYYFRDGVWYRPSGTRFVVVMPPIGLTLSILPPYYTTLWVGGVPYYYADGVYYNWHPAQRTYVVVDPPQESEVVSLPPEPEQLFVYPKLGQGEQQMATDRYECHRWAVDQTAFDPSQPDTDLAETELAPKRADYQRATKACLEARGYSVK